MYEVSRWLSCHIKLRLKKTLVSYYFSLQVINVKSLFCSLYLAKFELKLDAKFKQRKTCVEEEKQTHESFRLRVLYLQNIRKV